MRTATINIRRVSKDGFRFEGKYFLNDYSFLSMQIEDMNNGIVLGNLADVFNPPVFKRQFCKETKRSIPYFQSSYVQNASEYSDVYIFGQQAERLNLKVKKGDILITGFGTIGNTRLVNRHQDGVCYANNVCRVRSHSNVLAGFIYAFLSSKFGTAQLNKNASGSVVRYIEAPGIKRTLIPDFPEEFQKEIDGMIQESARLREEAADALAEAVGYFENELVISDKKNYYREVSIKDILSSQNHRIEGNYYCADGADYIDLITAKYNYEPLSYFFSNISRPDIFKRMYVKENAGLMFFGSSELFMATPKSAKFVSKRTPGIDSLVLQEGWVLLPRSGTIGDVAYATSQHAQKLASEHVIRLVPNNILRGAYAYVFLLSSAGKKILQRAVFGSVIQHVEPPMLEVIPVPIFKAKFESIASLAITANKKLGNAGKLELDAIAKVEAEIEKWGK